MWKAISFTVSGVVQGVGFRFATAYEARSLQLAGWVKNQADGTVAGAAAGASGAVSQFETFLKKGPPHARVDNLDVQTLDDSAASNLPPSFEIRK
ncbi:hypothetical protein V8E36_008830 [Tilletia maclaganii]